VQRKNLAAIANLIVHVATQDFSSNNDWFVRTPLQEYIRSDGLAFRDWVMDGERDNEAELTPVAAVDPLESYFQAHELFESTTEAKPIMITRTEIYGMLSVLIKHTKTLVSLQARITLKSDRWESERPDRGGIARTRRPACRL
jgi:Ras GTPase-activating-like protein IQGAP2/3